MHILSKLNLFKRRKSLYTLAYIEVLHLLKRLQFENRASLSSLKLSLFLEN